jgi:predicted ABC-type ATPase
LSDPVLHILAGPNGAGKTTLYERVIEPSTHLRFVNADRIAAEHWPGDELTHAYDAASCAAAERDRLIGARRSFVTESVFSHPSKIDLLASARHAGYLIALHVVMIPVELAVLRVNERVARGGHAVPRQKIVERFDRLWEHVAVAVPIAHEVFVYDNSDATRPLQIIVHLRDGHPVTISPWPAWTPRALLESTSFGPPRS